MKNNNLHLGRITEIELRLIFGLIAIAFLNVIIYKSLSVGQPFGLILLNDVGIYVYAILLIMTMIFTIIRDRKLLTYSFYTLLSIMTINIILNLFDLIINHRISDNGQAIVLDATLIWISSLGVFGFWYWIVDRGGPINRAIESKDTRYDLLFPQYQSTIPGWEKWKPEFWDYVMFSFFTSTGFSPADTLPLSLRVKILMAIEATISLVIIGMVISRALSLIQ
ncbi:MAG TPA: hypothetical protein VHE53_00435 [Patescibacteria group bacterium]|nr:hypothetical protein [Patescibacteria group bacterium]